VKKYNDIITIMPRKIVGGELNELEGINGILFRYIPLALLYIVSLLYIYNNSTQYLLFICLLILNIFGVIFIIRDLFAIKVLYNCFFGIEDIGIEYSCNESGSTVLKIFVFALVIGILSQFISLAIFVSVFDYGRQTTNSFISGSLSGTNQRILYDYKGLLIYSSCIIIILAFFMMFSYGLKYKYEMSSIPVLMMRTIGCGILSAVLLGLTSYEIYLSVEFLKNKQNNTPLYIIS